MSNSTVKQTWWPIACAIFGLSWVVFFYIWKKSNEKNWLIWGIIYLVPYIAFCALYNQYQNELWSQLLIIPFWICGFFHCKIAWQKYQKTKQVWWPIVCGIFYLPFVVLCYVWKKSNELKWLVWGAIYLALFVAFFVFPKQYQDAVWFKVLMMLYWICGIVHSCIAWKELNKIDEV